MSVSLRSLAPGTRVNFSTAMQVSSRTIFNGFTFLGEVGYVAANAFADLMTLVAASRPYFRAGSPTDMTAITYILVKQSETSPIIVIPEPLLDLNSVEVAGNVRRVVRIMDDISEQALSQILSGNGLTNFSVTTEQV